MTCMGHYEIKHPIYKKFIEKNKCMQINGRLENGLVYLYWAFQFDVINASTTHQKNINHELIMPLLHVKSMFNVIEHFSNS